MERTYQRVEEARGEKEIFEQAQTALKNGYKDQAYTLSLVMTRDYPNNAQGWLLRSRVAESTEETMFALSQVNRLIPNHPSTKMYSYQAMWSLLERDPFLAYVDEDDDLYYVRSKEYLSLVVPKDRGIPEMYPSREPQPLAPAYRMLLYALVGLVLSGVGTLLFAPLALFNVMKARRRGLSPENKLKARVITWLALLLLGLAIILVFILALHFRGL